MSLKELKIKNLSYFFWNDMIYLKDFDKKYIRVVKRESRTDSRIYYISYEVYKPQYKISSVNPLYLIIKNVAGKVEQIKDSTYRYLVVDDSNKTALDVFSKLFKKIAERIDKINVNDDVFNIVAKDKINNINKWRFSSDVKLPNDQLIEFHALTIVVSAVIEQGDKFYPEIYVDEAITKYKNEISSN